MSAAAARAGDDRASLLGRKNRVVKQETAHLPVYTPQPLPDQPERIVPERYTGSDAERLAALETALDEVTGRATELIDRAKTWLDEQRGIVLREIRDAGLYKVKAHTFEEYVRDRWQMSRPRAYELMEAAPVLRILSGIPDTRPSVSQALALAPVLEEHGERGVRTVVEQGQALTEETGKRVTAKTYREIGQALGLGAQDDGGRDQEQEQRDAEEHARNESAGRKLHRARELADQAQRLADEAREEIAAGARPLQHGQALDDVSALRRVGNYLRAYKPEL
ncbi:hypothetical protein ACIQTN_33890 [Streptomyces werraensis]|uniref:hypothetical protein n=1 Tax=Streptomyces werraensis TaxID=68284 RepID=UPI0038063C1D